MRKGKLILLMSLIIAALLLCSCTSDNQANELVTTEEATTEAVTTEEERVYDMTEKTLKIKENLSNLKMLGRYGIAGTGISSDLSACGFEFNAYCSGDVYVKAEIIDNDAYYIVYIDGVKQKKYILYSKDKKTENLIASGLEEGLHTIRFIKASETRSPSTLYTLRLTGELVDPPTLSDVFIEFMGDSITCGYDLAYNDTINFDSSLAYGYICAEKLGADYSMVAISGYTITGKGSIPSKQFPYNESFTRDSHSAYKFSRKPTCIVVNLGTNESGSGNYKTTAAEFIAGVESFIKTARNKYKDDTIPIVFVYNMMRDGYQTQLLKKLSDLGGEENNLFSLKAERNNNGNGGHPDAAAQKKAGLALADFIEEKFLK